MISNCEIRTDLSLGSEVVAEKIGIHPLDEAVIEDFKTKLKDTWWRLNNLYYIIDTRGKKVRFRPNREQTKLFDDMWFMNIILKARQMGFTTFIDIFILDQCLWNPNVQAGIIAHNKEDVSKIFRSKIMFPYNNLPDCIKEAIPTITASKTSVEFSNGSNISVGTSMRSGTLQFLHVSEFGKVCAAFPEKAREIVTGAFEAVHTETKEAFLFVESTAEGRGGPFYDFCETAQKNKVEGIKLSSQMFKFHFFPWFNNVNNVQSEPLAIEQPLVKYFKNLSIKTGVTLTKEQCFWYVSKWTILGDDMKREHPSTPEEAFEATIKGAYFVDQFLKIRKEGRLCSVPYDETVSVDTWWDLGMNDVTSIWFTQDIGREIHVIDYYECSGEGFTHYRDMLDKKKYRYGTHNAPHDISVRELSTGESRIDAAAKIGINFNRLPRIAAKIDSINKTRGLLNLCWFDKVNCSEGIRQLELYHKTWNNSTGTFTNTPFHGPESNAADAFQSLGMGHDMRSTIVVARPIVQVSTPGCF